MISIKDYVITLAAVFLALALGIMIGISLSDTLVLENQREVIVSLEKQLEEKKQELELTGVREENYLLQLNKWEKLMSSLIPYLVSNRMQAMQVDLLYFGDQGMNDILHALNKHGGNIGTLVQVNSYRSEAVIEVAAQQNDWLVSCLRGQGAESVPEGVNVSYNDENVQPDLLLISGDISRENFGRLKNVLEDLQEDGICVAGITTEEKSQEPWLQTMANAGFPTVGHIDTAFGVLSLMEISVSGAGNFGFGSCFFPERWDFLEEAD